MSIAVTDGSQKSSKIEINVEDLDRSLSINWDMIPVDRSLDEDLVQDYIGQLSERDREFILRLLSVTTYIPYSQMKQDLEASFERFQNNIRDDSFYLYLPNTKIGSEHWLTAILWAKLRDLNLKGIIHSESDIPLGVKILIVDDAIYSGNNVLMAADQLSHNLSTKYNIPQSEIISQLSWHLVIPYISPLGSQEFLNFINSMGGNVSMYNIKHIQGLNTLIDVESYYPGDTFSELYEIFGFEGYDHPPVYFDHKVAAVNSTYPTIYLEGRIPGKKFFGSLLKNMPSREKIEELSDVLLR